METKIHIGNLILFYNFFFSYVSLCLCLCLSVSVYLSVCLSLSLYIYICICMYVCMYMGVRTRVCVWLYAVVCVSVLTYIWLSIQQWQILNRPILLSFYMTNHFTIKEAKKCWNVPDIFQALNSYSSNSALPLNYSRDNNFIKCLQST